MGGFDYQGEESGFDLASNGEPWKVLEHRKNLSIRQELNVREEDRTLWWGPKWLR